MKASDVLSEINKAAEKVSSRSLNESVEAIPRELNAVQNKGAVSCKGCGFTGRPMGKVCPECGTQVVK